MAGFADEKIEELKKLLAKEEGSAKVKVKSKPSRVYRPIRKQQALTFSKTRQYKNSLHPLGLVSKKSGKAGVVFATVRRLAWLSEKLKFQLGLPLSAHIELVNVQEEKVVVFVSNAAWGQRARFVQADILRILNPYYGGALRKVLVQVRR